MTSAPPMSERPRVWPLPFFYLLALMAVGSGSTVGVVFAPPPAGHGLLDPTSLPGLILGGEVGLGSFAFVAAGASRDKIADRLRLRLPRTPWRRSLLLLTAALGIAPLWRSIILLTGTPVRGVLVEISRGLQASSGASAFVIVIGGTVVAPVAEELFFRGFLQSRLTQRFGSLSSVVVTSVAFGVFHFDLYQGIFAFFLGLWLGALAEIGGSVLLPIAGHLVSNAVGIAPLPASRGACVALALVSTIFLASGATVLVRSWRESAPAREPARPTSRSQRWRIGLLFAYVVFTLTLFVIASALLAPTLATSGNDG